MAPFDRRLLTVVPPVRRAVLALGVLAAARGTAAIASAFALAWLVVAVVRGQPLPEPVSWVAGLFAVRALLEAAVEWLAARTGALVSTTLRERLLGAWAGRPADERPGRERAVTLAAQGTSTIEPYVARYLPALVGAAVVPLLAIVCLLVIDLPSGITVVLTVWLLPVFAALIGATTRDDTDRRWRALSDLSGHFLDVMRGLPTLVAYGRARRQVTAIAEVSRRHRRATMRTLRLAFLSSAALELLATISVAIVAVLVGLRLTTGSMELQVGLTAILLAPEAYWPIRRVGAEYHSAADGAVALDEVLTELAAEPRSMSAKGAARGAVLADSERGSAGRADGRVRLRGVGYTHPGSERAVLTGVDLEAGRGLTVLTGPSGAGKTTLLEIIAGLRRPTTGEVALPPVHLVSQRPFLGAGTLAENLLLGAPGGTDELAAWQALREVGLDGAVASLPGGLSAGIGDDGFGLSAGQRARLVLARALLSDAPVLLLDEPTAHVDTGSVEHIGRVVRGLAEERTVIAVTHQPGLAALADTRLDLSAMPTEVAR